MNTERNPAQVSKRVLVIDDQKNQRNIIKDVLTPFYEVIEAEHIEQAVELAQQLPPDLVLLGVMLDTEDSVAALQSGKLSFQAPIIVVTGRRGEALRERIVGQENICDFLYKPYDEEQLLHIVQRQLEPKRPSADARPTLQQNYDEKVPSETPSPIICACNAMVDAKRRIQAFARSQITVLIRGETGTGNTICSF